VSKDVLTQKVAEACLLADPTNPGLHNQLMQIFTANAKAEANARANINVVTI